MAGPDKPNDAGLGKSDFKKYFVPAGAVVAVLILVGLVIAISATSGRKMSDGSDGSSTDSKLKEAAPGVRYRDIKEGVGDPCPAGADVTMHYTGWLEDGEVFDSTSENKKIPQAARFSLPDRIVGWQEGIPGMKAGGIRKLVIAPDKGYGATAKPNIPGNSTLIFEIELVAFTAPPKLTDGTDPNAPDPGLKDIGEGLKIRDLKEGKGDPVKDGGTVTIHYTGWLQSGKVFDSSRPRGEPNTFGLGGLIKGWQKGIPGMKPGGIRKLVVPPELGYGAGGTGGIPGNATLVFEVELVH